MTKLTHPWSQIIKEDLQQGLALCVLDLRLSRNLNTQYKYVSVYKSNVEGISCVLLGFCPVRVFVIFTIRFVLKTAGAPSAGADKCTAIALVHQMGK